MHVVPEPENILAALICALEQPHTITERGGDLFIVPPPGADKMYLSAAVTPPVRRSARCTQCGGKSAAIQLPGWSEWPGAAT
jgi:hypothetical protein